MDTVLQKIQQIVAELFEVNIQKVTPVTSFFDDLGADSLDIVELVIAIEDEFEIKISAEDAEMKGRKNRGSE